MMARLKIVKLQRSKSLRFYCILDNDILWDRVVVGVLSIRIPAGELVNADIYVKEAI